MMIADMEAYKQRGGVTADMLRDRCVPKPDLDALRADQDSKIEAGRRKTEAARAAIDYGLEQSPGIGEGSF